MPVATYRMVLCFAMGRTVGGTMREGTGGEDMDRNANADGYGNDGGYGSEWARPPLWKIALAVLSILAGAVGLFAAIALRGLPGVAIGAAVAAGLILPGAWWLWHESREHRAAVDPDAPAAVLDRRWRFIAPIAVVLLALGSVLAVALPDPDAAPATNEEESSSQRTPPKPSKTSTSRTATQRPTATETSVTRTESSSETSSEETSTSESESTGTSTPTVPTTEPTTRPTTQPTQTQPTQPTQTQPLPPEPPQDPAGA